MRNRWSEEAVKGMSALELLVYQSRLIGEDEALVLWGGGNTSLKTVEKDHVGRDTRVIRIKGSGADLKESQAKDFPGLRLEEILPLIERGDMSDEEMVDYLANCQIYSHSSSRPSIETLLHAFLPFASVAHSHADAILSLTNNTLRDKAIKEVLGEDIIVIGYRRPGFLLAREVELAFRQSPESSAVVLVNHGLITCGGTAKEAYDRHIKVVSSAEEFIRMRTGKRSALGAITSAPLPDNKRRLVASRVAPLLRGLVSKPETAILRYDDSKKVLEFVGSSEARRVAEEGATSPDHLLRTRRRPLWVNATDTTSPKEVSNRIQDAVTKYGKTYASWFRRHSDGQFPLIDSNPRVVMVPGVGMWTVARDLKGAKIAADIYRHSIEVFRGAEAIGTYSSLGPGEVYQAEYWPLQFHKLNLLPREKELSRKIALVTGAARGIGAGIARRLAQEGAHVALADIDGSAVDRTVDEINQDVGDGRCIALQVDVANERGVQHVLESTCLAFGGLDILVSNAGVAQGATIEELDLGAWAKSIEVNATGHFLMARETVRVMKAQGLGGSLIFIATKNVTAPGGGFGAYSAAKAAEAQLARILAIENGAWSIRSNIVNPDAIFQGSRLWSQEIRRQRAEAHGISVEGLEDFYRQRNLLKTEVTAEDVAESVLFLSSGRSAKTTGAMLPVDGGIPEAFPR